MECVKNCRLCPRFIISLDITFTDGELVVNLPQRAYENGTKYCIVLAQTIPAETVINAPVVFTIGDDATTTYPFLNCDCTPIYASQVRTRTLYPTRVNTAVEEGVFKYIGRCCLPSNATTTIESLPIPAETEATGNTGSRGVKKGA